MKNDTLKRYDITVLGIVIMASAFYLILSQFYYEYLPVSFSVERPIFLFFILSGLFLGSKLIYIGLYPRKLNLLKIGIRSERWLKKLGYEFVLLYQLDIILVTAVTLSFFTSIKNIDGSTSYFRLFIYIFISSLTVYYLIKTKDIRELKKQEEEFKKIAKSHIYKYKTTPETVEETVTRFAKAFSHLHELVKKEGLNEFDERSVKILENKYPDEIQDILKLLNHDLKRSFSDIFTILSNITKVLMVKNFRPIEFENFKVLIYIFLLTILFIGHYILN